MTIAYKNIEDPISLEHFYNLTASGISRIRSDQEEFESIFNTLDAAKRTSIFNWFCSDDAKINHAWGFVELPETMPSVHHVLYSDHQSGGYIGNFESMSEPEDMDFYYENYTYQFSQSILTVIRYFDDPAYSYYIYKIIKYLIRTFVDELESTYNLKNVKINGKPTAAPQPEDIFIFQYEITVDYDVHEIHQKYDGTEELTDTELSQTKYLQSIQNIEDFNKNR